MSQETNSTIIEFLRQKIASTEAKYEQLKTRMVELKSEMDKVTEQLNAYRTVLRHEGGSIIPSQLKLDKPKTVAPGKSSYGGGRAPGNRSPLMPKRYPEFEAVSIGAAICKVVVGATRPLRAEDFARTIWDVKNKDEYRGALRNVRGELGKLVKLRKVHRAGKGAYVKEEPTA